MHIRSLQITNFRGIASATLDFGPRTLLVGENNVGKTTVLEAINLALGPDRAGRVDAIDEHDFFLGRYQATGATSDGPEIRIEVVLDALSADELSVFRSHVEPWNDATGALYSADDIAALDSVASVEHYVLRVTCIGRYNPDSDEFSAETVYSKTEASEGGPTTLTRRDKQRIGFLYLRAHRTAARAASLERGSLLDILLDLKGARPKVWTSVIQKLSDLGHALGEDTTFQGVLADLEARVGKYLPSRGNGRTRSGLLVSDLTRRQLRGVMRYFFESAERDHLVPLDRLGNGTTNILVLALLSAIADTKRNVIFAMEEPETALPPHTQRRILGEISRASAQAIVTSHSPYVAERFLTDDILVLRKDAGTVTGRLVQQAGGIDPKALRQGFRPRFAEGLLSTAVLLVEGISDRAAFAEANEVLSSLEGTAYTDLNILGITIVRCDTAGDLSKVTSFYSALGLPVFVLSDNRPDSESRGILGAGAIWHKNLPYAGLEELLRAEAAIGPMKAFLETARQRSDWPRHLASPPPAADDTTWRSFFFEVLCQRKGEEYAGAFVASLTPDQLPRSLLEVVVTVSTSVAGTRLPHTDPLHALIGDLAPDVFTPDEHAASTDG